MITTNFNENTIVSNGGFKPSTIDTPIDIRTRIATISEVSEIPLPYVGMIFYVLDEACHYKVKSLKSKLIKDEFEVQNSVINEYEPLNSKSVATGQDGKSAYEIAVENGFQGSKAEWLESLKGKTGATGPQGIQGLKGDRGEKGEKGQKGDTGARGEQGIPGPKGDTGLQGPAGQKGEQGEKGDKGIYVGSKDSAPLTADIVIDDSDEGLYMNELVETPIEESTLTLSLNKYQTVTMKNNTTIALPSVDKFTEIHLFFTATEELTLTLPNIRWQSQPTIAANKAYEFIFTYTTEWLGECVVYEQKADSE